MISEARHLDRRGFLRVGGVTVGLAALTAACVNQREAEQLTQTGTRVPAPSTSQPPFPGNAVLDARLVLTALSVERLAIDTFDTVLKENWVATPITAELARKLQERHRAHADTLAGLAAGLGQNAGEVKANADVKTDLVDNELDTVREATGPQQREVESLKLLAIVEDALAQLYARAGGLVTTPELRGSLGAIGVSTARQYTALSGPAGQSPAPLPFMPTAPAAIPEDVYVVVVEASVRPPGTVRAGQALAAPGTTR